MIANQLIHLLLTRLNRANMYHHVRLIHGNVAPGALVLQTEYKQEVAVKHMIVRQLKMHRQKHHKIVLLQINLALIRVHSNLQIRIVL